jgi:hypothetical protein
MNLDELIAQVDRVIQDDDFDGDVITTYLNRGMLEISGGIRRYDSSVLTQPLPELYVIGTVATTDVCKASLPVLYQRDVVMAVDYLGRELTIYDSFTEFAKTYPLMTATGYINALAIKGRDLYYQNIPVVSELVTIHYHRYPEDMTIGSDSPDGLPVHFHNILVDYVCKEFFNIIEDGLDGKNVNTSKYEIRFQKGIEALDASISADAPPFRFSA